ncbi:MAG: DegT/DnrJ/EryC1/StrS family aminotransferase, partial [Cyanobacteria bacterium]|nr:DegT/DnrJ/EryC1/StrS family aminotransferase [Cyanobacteriota bacterium]
KRYTEGLKDIVVTPTEASGNHHVYHLYVIQTSHREELQEFLLERSIQTLIHYPVPAHLQKAYKFLGNKEGFLPATEYVTKRIVSLPIYPQLTDEQVDFVIESIREFYKLKSLKPEYQRGESNANADEKSYEVATNAAPSR